MKRCNALTIQHTRCKNNAETCTHHSKKSHSKKKLNFRLRDHNVGDLAFMCVIDEIYFYFFPGRINNGHELLAQLSDDLDMSPELILSAFPWFRQYLDSSRAEITDDIGGMVYDFLESHPHIQAQFVFEMNDEVKTYYIVDENASTDIMATTLVKRYLNRRG